MNNVVLMGRLTRDPDVRYSQSEQPMAIARYTLAVDRRFKRDGEQTADFISCVSFGRTGEFVEKYLRQGTKVVIRGRIQTGSYTNRDGQKVYTTDVVAEDVEFAESKNSSQNGGNGGNGGFQSFDHNPAPSAPAGDGFMNIPDGIEEELPFN
jgi:single-strand DNA-binding protein